MQSSKQVLIMVGLFALFMLLLTVGIHTALLDNSLGYDYYFYWQAGRALFMEGLNPYSIEITLRSHLMLYGHSPQPGEFLTPFYYPLPILFISLPFTFLNYDWSQAAWMAFNLLVPMAVGMLLFRHSPKWLVLTLPLFYQIVFIWIVGNYSLLIGMIFIVIFYALFYAERSPGWADFLYGLSLAWVTNKPQMVWLYVALALFVILRQRRWQMMKGFVVGLAGIHLAALILLPDWPAQWLNVLHYYPQQSAHTPALVAYLHYLLPKNMVLTVSIILALPIIAVTAWLFRIWWQGNLPNLLILAWCGLVTSLADPSALTPDQIVLLVPLFLWAVHQRPTIGLKFGWFGAVSITNILFFLSLLGVLPGAVDRAPLLVYAAWLAGVWHNGSAVYIPRAPGMEKILSG